MRLPSVLERNKSHITTRLESEAYYKLIGRKPQAIPSISNEKYTIKLFLKGIENIKKSHTIRLVFEFNYKQG